MLRVQITTHAHLCSHATKANNTFRGIAKVFRGIVRGIVCLEN